MSHGLAASSPHRVEAVLTDTPFQKVGFRSHHLSTPPRSTSRTAFTRVASVSPTAKRPEETAESKLLLSPAFSSPVTSLAPYPKPLQPSFTRATQPSSPVADLAPHPATPLVELAGVAPHPATPVAELAADGLPVIADCGSAKPPYSYATLIGMAVLRSQDRRLTLSQIYQWIIDTFAYYRKSDVGWQNSIRHNLSLNKAFIKGDRSKDGKGHYWLVQDGYESRFTKSRASRKGDKKARTKAGKKPQVASQAAPQAVPAYFYLMQKTPVNKIVGFEPFPVAFPTMQLLDTPSPRPGLKRARTTIGFECGPVLKGGLGEAEEEEGTKRPRLLSGGSTPSLVSHWSLSALADHTFTRMADAHRSGSPSDSPLARCFHPQTRDFPLASSFSCTSSIELSPLKASQTGPLLEPMTPAARLGVPKTVMRTPLTNPIRTPSSASIMKRIWNSPSYLDDFYTSPSLSRSGGGSGSGGDEDIIARACFGSPNKRDIRRKPWDHAGPNLVVSDLYGVDICSVVKRAIESVNHLPSVTDGDDIVTTDDAQGR